MLPADLSVALTSLSLFKPEDLKKKSYDLDRYEPDSNKWKEVEKWFFFFL